MDRRRWERIAEAAGGAGLLALWGALALDFLLFRLEWSDWVGFALPAANLVERGALAVPQLGSQMGFDEGWLFSSALMGLGPAPLFALFGVGRLQYLAGIALVAALNLALFAWAARRALGGPRSRAGLAVSACAALVFLAARGHTESLSLQRYDLAVFSLVLAAYFPLGRGAAAYAPWQAAAAGLLPLAHPAVAPLAPLWLLLRLVDARAAAWRGVLAWFGAGALVSLLWYARPEFLTQFVPHLAFPRGGPLEAPARFEGMLDNWSWRLGYPSAALFVVEAVVALGVLARTAAARTRGRALQLPAGVIEASAGIALGLALDAVWGFHFLRFYMIGLGPCLLALIPRIRPERARGVAAAALAFAGIANLAVMAWMSKRTPRFAGRADAVAFVTAHTRPGERIALGPPFVLASVKSDWADGREAARVVPQSFYLEKFDATAYRSEVAALTDVYVGAAEWFSRPAVALLTPAFEGPLYRVSNVEEFDYFGETVIVARKTR